MKAFRACELKAAEKNWNDMYFDIEGIPRWKSNDRVPMNDMLDMWKYLGKDFNYEKANETRQKEDEEAIKQYCNRRAEYRYSDEELIEMRAAFGEGQEVVDILTGESIIL